MASVCGPFLASRSQTCCVSWRRRDVSSEGPTSWHSGIRGLCHVLQHGPVLRVTVLCSKALKQLCTDCRDGGRDRETHRWAASHMTSTGAGDWTCNPGACP